MADVSRRRPRGPSKRPNPCKGRARVPDSEFKARYRKTHNGIPLHRFIVERRTGIRLPPTAVVHHVDPKDKVTNRGLFVVCQDHSYHQLLHMRTDALGACENPNWRKCEKCNPGETVLTPFLGVASEAFAAVRAGRRAVGVELKPSYYRQAVKNLQLADSPRAEQEAFTLHEAEV